MKLSIGNKLMLLFGIMAAIFISFTLYVRIDLKEFEGDITRSRITEEEIMLAKNLQLHILNVGQFMTDASLTKDRNVIDKEAKPNLQDAKSSIDKFLTLGDEYEHSEQMNILKGDLDKLWSTGIRMFDAYSESQEQGNAVMDEFDNVSDKIMKTVGALLNEETREGADTTQEMFGMVETSLSVTNVVLLLVIVVSLGILFFLRTLSHSITKPLAELVKAANKIADGDLSVNIEGIKSNNEVGELANDFNKMVNRLKVIITQVKEGVLSLASVADDLTVSAIQIVEGAQEQSMKSTQVATASHELNATITDVASNASGAAESARDANSVASAGGVIVEKSIVSINSIAETSRETAKVMSVLGDRSTEVGDIIKVIDDIASQTNLLALNAAIEAARAGEQGRGFAVVADEVRKLAEKTTGATKEIGETIKVIQSDTTRAIASMEHEIKAVDDGVSLAQDAGNALKEIVEKVEYVSSMIEQIATASEEQSTAAEQIGNDIESVVDISQGTSDSAHKIATNSQELAILANSLRSTVSIFKLSDPSGKPKVEKNENANADSETLTSAN